MTAAAAFTWPFAALLVIAGLHKITQPAATGAALQGANLPSDHRLVRLLGVGEVVLGGAVLIGGGWAPAGVLALTYAAFAVFAFRQSRKGADCGCFGNANAPATTLHVVVNAVGAAGAALAAIAPGPPLGAALSGGGVGGLLAAALTAVAAAVLRLLLTLLPELTTAIRLHTTGADA